MTREARAAALEAGAAMVLDEGVSIRQASRTLDIPFGTLREAIQRFASQPDRVKESADHLAAAHVSMAHKAADRLYGMIDDLPPAELIRVYGVASDKVAVHQGWGSRSQDASNPMAAAEALAAVAQALTGKTVSLTVTSNDPTTVDVTGSVTGDE